MSVYGGFDGNGNGNKPNGIYPDPNRNSANPSFSSPTPLRSYRPTPLPPTDKPRYQRGGTLLGSLLNGAATGASSGALLQQQRENLKMQQEQLRMQEEQLRLEQQRQMQLQQQRQIQLRQQMLQQERARMDQQFERQMAALGGQPANVPQPPQQPAGIRMNAPRVCANCGMENIGEGSYCEFCGSIL